MKLYFLRRPISHEQAAVLRYADIPVVGFPAAKREEDLPDQLRSYGIVGWPYEDVCFAEVLYVMPPLPSVYAPLWLVGGACRADLLRQYGDNDAVVINPDVSQLGDAIKPLKNRIKHLKELAKRRYKQGELPLRGNQSTAGGPGVPS